jgi:hypothetical protein
MCHSEHWLSEPHGSLLSGQGDGLPKLIACSPIKLSIPRGTTLCVSLDILLAHATMLAASADTFIRYVPGGEQSSAHRKTTPTHRQVHRCPCSKIYPCGTQFAGADVD